jgi:hypothetical protein
MEGEGHCHDRLSLSPDNDKVPGGMLVTRGLSGLKETRLACSVIWQDVTPDYYLALNFPTVDIFRLVITVALVLMPHLFTHCGSN